jgi:hypothetical protein
VQDIFTAAKVFALVIIIMAGIVWLGFGHTERLEEPMKNTDWSPGGIFIQIVPFISEIFYLI